MLFSRFNEIVRLSVVLTSGLSCLGWCLQAQDVLTFHNDAARSGVQSQETILSPTSVNSATFGKLTTFSVDGYVFPQPLYVSNYAISDSKQHNVLIVATEHDWVYAFDADGNNPPAGYLWRTSLLGTGETWANYGDVGTYDIYPDIGIVGTPVIDRTAGVIYVIAKSKTTSGTLRFIQRLHALNLATGTEQLNGPTVIQASLPGTGDGQTTVSFDPFRNNQRAALLLAPTPGGSSPRSVFIAWGSHGDNTPYHGWVISYNAADISQQTGAWVDTPNGAQGGIWMSAGGLSTDGAGNIFGASGNGSFDANQSGSDYAETLFKLQPATQTTGLVISDWFAPANELSESNSDQDFGVGGAPVIVPNQSGPIPHLILTADKTGRIFLLNRDNLGHFGNPANTDIQDFSNGGFSIHSNLVFFNNTLYLTPDGGPVEAWTFNPTTGTFDTTPQSKSVHTFGCNGCDGGGSNFSISGNGTAGGILWAVDYSLGSAGSPAVLYAYDATNVADELYDSGQASGNRDQAVVAVKFTAPTIANGKVFVAGRNGVTVYGLFPVTVPTAAAPAFSPVAGTYSGAQSVTLSDSTPNATIYYAIDGSNPTTSSAVYSTPISITATTTIKAIATAPTYLTSSVASATYTISTSGDGSVSDGGGFAGANMALNGSAKIYGSRLRLTDEGQKEAGSAFFPTTLSVLNFVTDFSFQLTKPKADGFTFAIQGVGPTAIGSFGGALGYGPKTPKGSSGIPKSIAVKFDLYSNLGEGNNSTGLYKNGAYPATPATDLTAAGINLHSSHVFQAHAAYDGTTLNITITDTITKSSATQSYTVNIPATVGGNSAFVGFTGGTGGVTATQDILTWTYSSNH